MVGFDKCPESGKRIYRSHDEIVRDCGTRYEPYICRYCRYWHRTKTNAEQRATRRAALALMVSEAETAGLYDANTWQKFRTTWGIRWRYEPPVSS